MTIHHHIERLIQYGLQKKLISEWEIDYVYNSLLQLFKVEEVIPSTSMMNEYLDTPVPILENMLDYAFQIGLIEDNTVTERDLFDPKIMNQLMPRPSEVISEFFKRYETVGAKSATHYFYQLSQDSHYIRTDRIRKNKHWLSKTEYGDLEITINLSKPEKDPTAIAKAKLKPSASYPKCLLCKENVGYAGSFNHPARENHRIIPIELETEQWFLQYSPYVYYNEHAIILSGEHRPMKISIEGFDRLLHFTEQFPHYFIGSNADIPIVGGSILSHDHYQGGHHEFPMAKAPTDVTFSIEGYEDIEAGIVRWPMSVIRLIGVNRKRVSELAGVILDSWRGYSDEKADILAETDDGPHNTITPIARNRDGKFELDLVLRNNRTNEQYPMGIFHPHEEVHHLKKENIGLIEVMGLAVLPGRLVNELNQLAEYILQEELETKAIKDKQTAHHFPWAQEIVGKYGRLTRENIHEMIQQEIGKRFSIVLEHAGVFKRNKEGKDAFFRFIEQIKQ
ncbi:UDPglucose--hexose-1-phosphate uridylyltransferase [Bacillus pakistanensis]|uniref:Galactose-1-phosphate uridylyltransferase n=1 Tax=Rossellomorea pakistanensis TaxID=992288 RepID=A0ABS2N6L4_9BACI|nr:UDP-glucose--hexose-1-phosphate uridylyltransferase [Bacillus pakistanensis]MBM7583483.1 UDPglucose--hexose-1-phosphate uridylyltransferase [Bacillus pakistanensis]